jgi:hypothetical protein
MAGLERHNTLDSAGSLEAMARSQSRDKNVMIIVEFDGQTSSLNVSKSNYSYQDT